MTAVSSPELLVLHSVRILGFADTAAIARRFGVDPAATEEILLDAQAFGWVQRAEFADLCGWSLTESGRAENERQLHEEREATGKTHAVWGVYRNFLPLNTRLLRACTDWQLRPGEANKLIVNDHGDTASDEKVLDELALIGDALSPLVDQLSSVLARFVGYDTRFAAALNHARTGEHGYVDRTDIDSCHRVWFELHEDLIATLGRDRRSEPAYDAEVRREGRGCL